MSSSSYYLYDPRYQQKALQERSSNLQQQQQQQSLYFSDDGDFSKMGMFPGVALPPKPQVPPEQHYHSTDMNDYDPDSRKFWQDIYEQADYVKSLALQCAAYKSYREKNKDAVARDTSSLGKNEGLKWPDILENAFWRACVRFPPRYRVKGSWQGSQAKYGRNQLISKSIEQETGFVIDEAGDEKEAEDEGQGPTKEKPRKFISSHIQVITGHMNKETAIPFKYKAQVLKYLISDKPKKPMPGMRMTRGKPPRRSGRDFTTHTSERESRRMAPYHLSQSRSSRLPMEYDFRMFVHATNDPEQHILHSYTRSYENARRQDIRLENHPELYDRIPPFKTYQPTRQERCEIFVAESLISLPSQAFPNDSSITIENVLSLDEPLNPALEWSTRTMIFSERNNLPSFSQKNNIDIAQRKDGRGKWPHTMYFGSSWWRDHLHHWAGAMRIANTNSHKDAPDGMAARREKLRYRVKRQLEGTIAVQEVVGCPSLGSSSQQRTERRFVFFWTFRLAEKHEKPRVKYHRVQQDFENLPTPEELPRYTVPPPYIHVSPAEESVDQRVSALDTQAFDLSFSAFDPNAAMLSFDQSLYDFEGLQDIPEMINIPSIISNDGVSEPRTAEISPTHGSFESQLSRRGSYHDDLSLQSAVSFGEADHKQHHQHLHHHPDQYSGLSILAGAAVVRPEAHRDPNVLRSQNEPVLAQPATLPSQAVPSSSWPHTQQQQQQRLSDSTSDSQPPQEQSYLYAMPSYWSQSVQHLHQHVHVHNPDYPRHAQPQPIHARPSHSILSAKDDDIVSSHIAQASHKLSHAHSHANYVLDHSYNANDMKPRVVDITTPRAENAPGDYRRSEDRLQSPQARGGAEDSGGYESSYFMSLAGEQAQGGGRGHEQVFSPVQGASMPIEGQ